MPKISIIIPVYNMECYISEALNSVLNQTFKDIEILCIDDCSQDNSLKILNEYASKDNRIRVFHFDKNMSTGYARNYAIEKAQGEYIMFLDPDDWYENNACELAYEQIKKYDNDIVIFNNYKYNENTQKQILQERIKIFKSVSDKNHINIEQVPESIISYFAVWNKIYKKEFLNKNKIVFTETVSGEDRPFTLKCFLESNDISILEKPLYNLRKYRTQRAQRVYKRWNDIYFNWEKCYDLIVNSGKKQIFLDIYVGFLINELIKRYNFIKINKELQEVVFEKSQNFLKKINENHDVKNLKKNINYSSFKNFINSKNYNEFELKEYLYPVKFNKNHIIFNIFGMKIKFKIFYN